MHGNSFPSEEIVSEYWRTYYEWRGAYGLLDNCMNELLAAILVESEQQSLTEIQRDKLRALVQLIETERQALIEQAA